jgi:hypothetical protein
MLVSQLLPIQSKPPQPHRFSHNTKIKEKKWPSHDPFKGGKSQWRSIVATLALSSRPKQGGCKVAGQKGARESSHMLLGEQKSEGKWTITLPRGIQFWELESRWTPESLESDSRGQNSIDWRIFYSIGKILELRYLKWAHIAHLDIWNISYGQKKGRESNCQFDSRPLKVGNRPDLLVGRERATYHWKALDESYNFALDCMSIGGLFTKLWGSKVAGVPTWAIFGLPRRESPVKKFIWMWVPWTNAEYTIRGKVVASPKSGPWWILCVRVARGSS